MSIPCQARPWQPNKGHGGEYWATARSLLQPCCSQPPGQPFEAEGQSHPSLSGPAAATFQKVSYQIKVESNAPFLLTLDR